VRISEFAVMGRQRTPSRAAVASLFIRVRRLLFFVVFSCASLFALDSSRRITQYSHTAWRIQDGFFGGTPQAITQTTDGYLWIATEGGLVRFDGVRFVPWTPPNGKRLPSNSIHSVLGARDGSLWIGTSRGLAHWNNLDLVNVTMPPAFVEAILEDARGAIWITRSQIHDAEGPLCEVIGEAVHCHGAADGIPFAYAQPLFGDTVGNLWIGSSLGVCRWRPDGSNTFVDKALTSAKGLQGVGAINVGPNGSILVGLRRSGKGLGLQQLVQGTWIDYALPGLDGSRLNIAALLTDRDNELWIGTPNHGIYRVHGDHADHFGSEDGLSSDSVQAFYEDREGSLWVVTSRGIDRFHDTRVVSYSMREGLTSEDVGSVVASRDGSVWIANYEALDILREGKLSALTKRKGLPGTLITSLFEDHAGNLWVGVDNGLTIYEEGKFRPVNRPDGKSVGVVTAIAEDMDHSIWVAVTQPSLFRIKDQQVAEEIQPPRIPRVLSMAADPKEGIWLGLSNGNLVRYRRGEMETISTARHPNVALRNLIVESDGSAWWATQEGVFRWKGGKEETLNSANGLGCDDVFGLLIDNRGSLWLDAQCGFVAIGASELQRWWQNPDVRVEVTTLDVFDGAQPGTTNFRPEISKSPDGKLWFANENILQVVDPGHLKENDVPPPVQVEKIIADRKTYLPAENPRLPALTRDVEIDYTALSFVVPEKVQFRYKLAGRDSEWQNPQNRRQAFYSDLPPGKYRFSVVASNNDGIWNETGAAIGFTVLPAFYQTTWFKLFCSLAAAGTLWLFYVLRVRHLATRMQARFAERLEERERIARDLHDTLLQGIFSASIQFDVANNRLPGDSPAKPLLQRGIELMRQVSQEGRNTLRTLRSQERGSDDLEQALSQIQRELSIPEGIDFRVVTQGRPQVLQPLIRDEVYRITREAIINAFRHSHASKIEVEVDYVSRDLRVSVRDDGCGIDPRILQTGRDGHWGLAGMRERAEQIEGRLEVSSRLKAGTQVDLWIPGTVAFPSAATGRAWNWLARLYPEKRKIREEQSNKELHK
jgi:signal transduction histidine kinase/ligand-binding sensor domain-containing protein